MLSNTYSVGAVGLIMLTASLFFLPIDICESKEDGNILYVGGTEDGNYSTIQDAIENSVSGDIIYVYNGIYYEQIIISQSVSLIGQEKNTTIIDGSLLDNVIKITADRVTIQGFTIQNSGDIFPNAGINVSSDFNTIFRNIITSNLYGITLFQTSNNIISENMILNNDHCGIYMIAASNNDIKKNIIQHHNFNGIGMYDSSDFNNIIENTLTNNNYCGINIRISSNNNITKNTISDNNNGILVPTSNYQNKISENVFSNNKNDIKNEFGLPIFESLIVFLTLVLLTIFILFWKEKSNKKLPTSKDIKHSINAIGKQCPIPLIMTKKKMVKMKKGEVLELITTDFVVEENLERFGREKHELIRIDREGDKIKIYIRK